VPVIKPIGAHAVYLNAREFVPNIPSEQFPGQSIACELYSKAGIRGCEIGTLMFGHSNGIAGNSGQTVANMDLVRLAIPRRVYTLSHLDYVIDALAEIYRNRDNLKGYKIVRESEFLRHFTAVLKPL